MGKTTYAGSGEKYAAGKILWRSDRDRTSAKQAIQTPDQKHIKAHGSRSDTRVETTTYAGGGEKYTAG